MDEIIEAAARAIDEATIGYSIRLTKLTDDGSEYTATIDGHEPRVFEDMDDAREWVGHITREAKARAVIAAIMPAIGERMAGICENMPIQIYRDEGMGVVGRSCKPATFDDAADRIRALANTMAAEVGK